MNGFAQPEYHSMAAHKTDANFRKNIFFSIYDVLGNLLFKDKRPTCALYISNNLSLTSPKNKTKTKLKSQIRTENEQQSSF